MFIEKELNPNLRPIDQNSDLRIKLPEINADNGTYAIDNICSAENITLYPMIPCVVKTGLYAEIPEGSVLILSSNDEMALQDGVIVLNSPMTKSGEINLILMWNGRSKFDTDNCNIFKITAYTKIAKAVLCFGYSPIMNGGEVFDSAMGHVTTSPLSNFTSNENEEIKHTIGELADAVDVLQNKVNYLFSKIDS